MRALFTAPAALALGGCAMNDAAPATFPQETGRKVCEAAPVQGLVGEKATAAMGARILGESGARTLRWGPPNSAWTMDYREDRVNVSYDADMVIERITCG